MLVWGDSERLRVTAVCLISVFLFGGIAIIEPLGGLHDSISNIALGSSYLQGTLPESAAPYVFNFPGAYTFLGITSEVMGVQAFDFTRLFPLISLLIYVPAFLVLGRRIASVNRTVILPLFIIVFFGDFLYLRTNPAPITYAALLSATAVIVIGSKANRLALRIVLIVLMFAIIVAHPVAALLVVPILIAFEYANGSREAKNKSIALTVLSSSLFLGWLVLQGGYTFSSGVTILGNAMAQTSPGPPFRTAGTGALGQTLFALLNRIHLITALGALGVLLVAGFRTEWRKPTIVHIALALPIFLVFTAVGLMTRFLSIEVIFIAVLAGSGLQQMPSWLLPPPTQSHNNAPTTARPSRRAAAIAFASLLTLSAVLGVYTSFWVQNAYDRPTSSEQAGFHFLDGFSFSGSIYAGGYRGDLILRNRLVGGEWGIATQATILGQDYVLITEQAANAFVVVQGEGYPQTTLGLAERQLRDTQAKVYDNGFARLYVKA